jgi:hypothetical protein
MRMALKKTCKGGKIRYPDNRIEFMGPTGRLIGAPVAVR